MGIVQNNLVRKYIVSTAISLIYYLYILVVLPLRNLGRKSVSGVETMTKITWQIRDILATFHTSWVRSHWAEYPDNFGITLSNI